MQHRALERTLCSACSFECLISEIPRCVRIYIAITSAYAEVHDRTLLAVPAMRRPEPSIEKLLRYRVVAIDAPRLTATIYTPPWRAPCAKRIGWLVFAVSSIGAML